MITLRITTELITEGSKKLKREIPFKIKNSYHFSNCYTIEGFLFNRKNSILLLLQIQEKELLGLLEKPYFVKNLSKICSEEIADEISFSFNIPLKIGKIYRSKPEEINLFISNRKKIQLVGAYKKTKEKREILEALREIKNEKSKPLRFLMYYRMIECLSREKKENVDKFIKNSGDKMVFIPGSRNPTSSETLMTHLRNKIHPTKPTYRFPYRVLSSNLSRIEKLTRTAIREIILNDKS